MQTSRPPLPTNGDHPHPPAQIQAKITRTLGGFGSDSHAPSWAERRYPAIRKARVVGIVDDVADGIVLVLALGADSKLRPGTVMLVYPLAGRPGWW